ncbi:sialate O-acetylesterase [Clostridium sp. KNHs205]|jgi:sialate O-acetylesterase|uniref:sialate O-acetylesterase n=1 Tax=Clostridium sp. KNHs205 TaxID=1449050 RepID=UPI00051B833E|nr:sialate O-acetylesterase [Clostridium sp. KNHs205]
MAKFKTAAIFSDHMVLQRDKNICIFGQGENNKTVVVTFNGNTYETKVKAESWSLLLPPMKAGTGYELNVRCENEVRHFVNVAIGEVWLAGGQSNMEYELSNCKGGQEMLKKDIGSNVRYFYSNKMSYIDEGFYENEAKTSWAEFSEENAKQWSAVGYIFAKKLAEELNVTVGVIGCNWGGTSATCWMSEEAVREDAELNTYWEEYYKETEGKTEELQIKEFKEYEDYHEKWDKECTRLYSEDTEMTWEKVQEILGPCLWPGPKSCMNPFRPSGLYHTILKRLVPYTLRGFIYYQGESDDHKPDMYQKLLTRLIKQWRSDWRDQTLPFLLVQLPMHRYKDTQDFKNWCLIREAQMNTFQTVKNTGIAVTLDCGEFNEIHPKDKKLVGERLAQQALYHVFHKSSEKEAFGPVYRSFEYLEGGIELSFDYAQEGFEVRGEYNGFEIADDELNYQPAQYEIRDSKIFVYSNQIVKPEAVRYCWTNYSEVALFGKNGIPLAPFRTRS